MLSWELVATDTSVLIYGPGGLEIVLSNFLAHRPSAADPTPPASGVDHSDESERGHAEPTCGGKESLYKSEYEKDSLTSGLTDHHSHCREQVETHVQRTWTYELEPGVLLQLISTRDTATSAPEQHRLQLGTKVSWMIPPDLAEQIHALRQDEQ